jgi:hypothetical protein
VVQTLLAALAVPVHMPLLLQVSLVVQSFMSLHEVPGEQLPVHAPLTQAMPEQTLHAPLVPPPHIDAVWLATGTQVLPLQHPVVHDAAVQAHWPPVQVPLWHWALTVHAPPSAVLATQAPEPLQTMLLPHPVPGAALVTWQTGAPVVQAICPGAHVVPHAMLAVQETQLPLPSHTWVAPQVVPGAAFVCAHTAAPVEQAILPGLHVVPQVMSLVQAMQFPLASHT